MTRVYTNSICRRGVQDPERTVSIINAETSCWNELVPLRDALLDSEESGNLNDNKLTQYIALVQSKLEKQHQYTLKWLTESKGVMKADSYCRVRHGRRRILAMYHQELELLKQGPEILRLAYADGDTIIQGIR